MFSTHTIFWIKQIANDKLKEFLLYSSFINTFFTDKLNSKLLFEIMDRLLLELSSSVSHTCQAKKMHQCIPGVTYRKWYVLGGYKARDMDYWHLNDQVRHCDMTDVMDSLYQRIVHEKRHLVIHVAFERRSPLSECRLWQWHSEQRDNHKRRSYDKLTSCSHSNICVLTLCALCSWVYQPWSQGGHWWHHCRSWYNRQSDVAHWDDLIVV